MRGMRIVLTTRLDLFILAFFYSKFVKKIVAKNGHIAFYQNAILVIKTIIMCQILRGIIFACPFLILTHFIIWKDILVNVHPVRGNFL